MSENRLIANVGLCAAAAVLVASLSILFLQGTPSHGGSLHVVQPSNLGSTPVLTPASSAGHVANQPAAGAHSDAVSANL